MFNFFYFNKIVNSILLILVFGIGYCFAKTNDDSYEIVLLGLYTNDREISNVDALRYNNTLYLSKSIIFAQLGIKPKETQTEWLFQAPIGDAIIAKSVMLVHQQQQYVPIQSLQALGVKAIFDQSALAIKLYVPWNNTNPFPNKHKNHSKVSPEQKIDYYPSFIGLGGITIDGGFNSYDSTVKSDNGEKINHYNNKSHYVNIGINGYLASGLWGAELAYKQQSFYDNATIENLYWTKSGTHWALRIGTNDNSNGITTGLYTGINLAYSNKNVLNHLEYAGSSSNQLLKNYNNISARNIKGTGPAGGIAELRVDGRAIARVRIGLDKKYEFVGLNLSNYQSSNYSVEVAIFEYSLSEPPITIDKPFLSRRNASVGTGELLLEFGVGKSGNLFQSKKNQDIDDDEIVAHSYAEYGLTNNIAVRGSIAKNTKKYNEDKRYESMVGINLGLPFNINADISYSNLSRGRVYEGSIDYDSKYFDLNYNYLREELNSNIDNGLIQKNDNTRKEQHLNIGIKPNDNIDLMLHGTHKKADLQLTERYFTARLNARLHENLYASIHKDRYNDYSYSVNWHIPKWHTNIYGDWDKDQRKLGFSTNVSEFLDVGASVTHWNNTNSQYYHGYVDYEYNDKNRFHVGVGHSDGRNSYDINWQYRPHNYGLVSVGYRKNQSVTEQNISSNNSLFNEDDYFYLQFSFDFIKKNNGGFTFGQYRPSRLGTLITDINIEDTELQTLDDTIQVKINGYTAEAKKINSTQYAVENIKPGIYELEFPIHSLPIEYQSETAKKSVIKVAKVATTVVDYDFKKTYGIAGQLTTEESGALIEVYQAEEKVSEVLTTAYGYYQIIGLAKGDYVLKVKNRPEKHITIVDKFVFEVDL
ncbi:MAG: hypothetical protein KGV50_04095 [Gammaproteobacteria bacterium]|nr:hypothetical protein [Gammaproteobacteria bacterium]